MASTITVPSLPQIQTNVAEIAKQAIAVATAAVTDIEALQASSSGKDWKESVRMATAAALAANTRTGNVLLADANGAIGAIDTSVTPIVGDRILVKNEVTGANNGLYTWTTLGAGGSKWSLTRATDADTSAEVTSGLVVQVEEGTANAGRVFELTTANPITLNTTALTFSAFAPGLVQTTDARLAPTPTAAGKMLYDNGTAYVATAAGTAGQFPVTNAGATAPVFVTMSGDATMTSTGTVTTTKVNGTTVPAGGALTTGNAAYVSGASALTYSALNLAGGAGFVTGILPAANIPYQVAQITLVAGTLTLAAGITITAASRVIPVLVTPGAGVSGTRYAVSGLTVGGPGTGAFTVTAKDSGAGNNTVNTDVSVLDCIIIG